MKKPRLLTADEAASEGFSQFNNNPHLCIDIPNGPFTISARTSKGNLVTFAFIPYEKDGAASCIDIHHDKSGKTHPERDDLFVQSLIVFAAGRDLLRTTHNNGKNATLTTLILDESGKEGK